MFSMRIFAEPVVHDYEVVAILWVKASIWAIIVIST